MTVMVTEECMGCQSCLDVCPLGAITMKVYAVVDEQNCAECGSCVDVCPVEAIVYKEQGRMIL